ncbi:class I SAM-dependent methyltransferase [Bailinhaonella thermotolerans]|uniref:Class I SAM-dependent methyltransferase n=1 Tax=Bailinhaonella thermotolerans TaxID=1070861 RepID=A0A3A4A7I3_9ACTN|nr:class I SAM-dependent methyltransferase [Bailinhaonella thermotolerans]RJL24545.1 class I SAM-dependent methyltransferase [Bailinhaonella thermotolerans]
MTVTTDWAGSWLESWDRQQEYYMPDREERFAAMFELVESVTGRSPRILDLACGPGSLSHRLLERLPDARIVAVDVDPALLILARESLGERVTVVRADLGEPDWTSRLPEREFDAVVTATALHWFDEKGLTRLYRDLAGVLRPGGVFTNADHMPALHPRFAGAVNAKRERDQESLRAEGVLDWKQWWQAAAEDPKLADAVAERTAFFSGDHASVEFMPPASWHLDTLRAAGFDAASEIWRGFDDAVIAAIR